MESLLPGLSSMVALLQNRPSCLQAPSHICSLASLPGGSLPRPAVSCWRQAGEVTQASRSSLNGREARQSWPQSGSGRKERRWWSISLGRCRNPEQGCCRCKGLDEGLYSRREARMGVSIVQNYLKVKGKITAYIQFLKFSTIILGFLNSAEL